MNLRSRNILIVENRLPNERLIWEIISQLDSKFVIRSMLDKGEFERHFDKRKDKTIPDTIIICHHTPDLNAAPIISRIRQDERFGGSEIYVIGNSSTITPFHWQELGVDRYLQWSDKPSELKAILSGAIAKQPANTR